jgi:hypothetical protein
MPPQQPERLLDLVNDGLDFGAHDGSWKGSDSAGDLTTHA